MSLPAETKSQHSLNPCQMQESIQAHQDSGLKGLTAQQIFKFKCGKCYNRPARLWSLYISINIWHIHLSSNMCSPCKQQKFIWSNGSYCNFCQIRATALAILYFLPLPGKVQKNDPSLEFGTQGAIPALYQLRHHGQQYLGLMLSHDLDTPLTQWSYCRPDILVCWMQLQGQGQCRMTKASQLQVTSRALLSF